MHPRDISHKVFQGQLGVRGANTAKKRKTGKGGTDIKMKHHTVNAKEKNGASESHLRREMKSCMTLTGLR